MKPETGSPDMEDCVWNPVELFVDVGILIVEARTPDLSPKGRSEGQHCPPAQGVQGVKVTPWHQCDLHREQCRRADQIKTQILKLSRNHIPLIIEVLLLPDCDHGRLEACSVDGSGVGCNDDSVLLERWEILLQQKRSDRVDSSSVTGRFLLQALRSYLHFSQLSSWLISKKGCLPLQIVYRLYSPGETVVPGFTDTGEMHSFPVADLGTERLKVSVVSMPRLAEIPNLLCQDEKNVSMRKKASPDRDLSPKVMSPTSILNKPSSDFGNSRSSASVPSIKPSQSVGSVPSIKPSLSVGAWSKKTEELRRTSPELFQDNGNNLPDLHQGTSLNRGGPIISQESGAIPKQRGQGPRGGVDSLTSKPPVVKKLQAQVPVERSGISPDVSELKMSFKAQPLPLLPDEPPNQRDSDFLVSRLPSPKVLFTSAGKSTQTFYKKRHLDLSSPESIEDRVLASKISNLVKPLNSDDLENYLASLSSHQPEKGLGASLSNIPTMHCKYCKFNVGDEPSSSLSKSDIGQLTSHDKSSLRRILQESSVSPDGVKAAGCHSSQTPQTGSQTPQRGNDSDVSVVCNLQKILSSESQNLHIHTDSVQPHSSSETKSKEDSWKSSIKNNERQDRQVQGALSHKHNVQPHSSSEPKLKDHWNSSIEHSEQRNKQVQSLSSHRESEEHSSVSSETYSLFDDFVDDICDLSASAMLKSIPCVNSRTEIESKVDKMQHESLTPTDVHIQNNSSEPQSLTPPSSQADPTQKYPDPTQKYPDPTQKYPGPRSNFRKSFSEPEMLGHQLTLCQLDELKLSPDENLSDLDSVLSKSFHDIFSLDKSSSDSTPTNSLSESNGFKHYCDIKSRDVFKDLTKSSTNSSTCKSSNNQDLMICTNSVTEVNAPDSQNYDRIKLGGSGRGEIERNGFKEDETDSGGSRRSMWERNEVGEEGSKIIAGASNRSGSQKTKSSLCQQLLKKELQRSYTSDSVEIHTKFPTQEQVHRFQRNLEQSSNMVFNSSTGLPSRSSPAPLKRKTVGRFDYDNTLVNSRAIKNALSCSKLTLDSESSRSAVTPDQSRILSTSAPASTNCLLGNFEESVLNGRIEPIGVVDGFTCDIGAGGSFCPKHVSLPVTAYFFQLSDDNAPSPYLGHINLENLGKKGYHIPKCGTVQVTLFNPNKTVIKMFVVMYDLSDMPPQCQTFLRQRTVYMPVEENSSQPSYLRYLIHLRFASSKSGKLFLHTDIRVLFARDKFEFDPNVAKYELRSFTEAPSNPKFSPRR
ncbi:atos homolog protein A-like [Ostrea edulis]|uniref:atos homolog protein A-like n=1 Tax=Ostrea edulis TaxID=37623 RepID=UPI0024AEDC9D|nr:atos homolog protein A-like [Ostrea edulis]